MSKLPAGTQRLLDSVHEGAASKLARNPVALDVSEVTAMTDVIYVCHGESGRAVEAITAAVLEKLEEDGVRVDHVEGLREQQWVLIDLGSVMVHVFVAERRGYYSLERLWHDARPIELPP